MESSEHHDRSNGKTLLKDEPRTRVSEAHRMEYGGPARRSYAWIWIMLILIGAAVVGYFIYQRIHEVDPKVSGRAAMAGRAVPVVTTTARKGEMNVYLDGLGTVTPLNTVVVRARVDGQLMNVAFSEGQTVKAGDLLFEIDPRPFQVQLEQAEGQMAKDQAQLKNAKADLERYQSAREAVSQQQLDTAAANVSNYEGAIKIDQGQIDSAKLQLTYCKVTAPLTGKIGLRMVDKGNIIHASDANGLAVITQLQPIAVLFSLPEENIPRVVKEMNGEAKLGVDAYDRDLKKKLASGKLLAIDSQIDQTSGTVRLKAVFENQDFALFPNQFVNARLLLDTIHDAVLLPSVAVQRSPETTFVYVVKGEKVEMRNIVVGPSEGDDTVIESGLAVGEVVVTDGVDKLDDGAKVSLGKPGGRPGAAQGGATQRSSTQPGAGGHGGGNRPAGDHGGENRAGGGRGPGGAGRTGAKGNP